MWCDVLSVTVGLVDIVVVAAIGVCFVYIKVTSTSTEAMETAKEENRDVKNRSLETTAVEEKDTEDAEERIGIEMGVHNTLKPKKKDVEVEVTIVL